VNSGEFVFENATCRYVVALRKFVLKVGTEIQLPLLQHPQVHGMFVKLRQHSHAVRGGGTHFDPDELLRPLQIASQQSSGYRPSRNAQRKSQQYSFR
jgi:hypothetical protein